MAVLLFLLAIIGGLVVGDLVMENTAAGQLILFGHTVGGYSQGWLLGLAAALGGLVVLLLVASMASRRTRRARRRELRAARRDMQERIAGLEDENQTLWDKLGQPDQAGAFHGEPPPPTDPRRTRWTDDLDHPRRTATPEPGESQAAPLYEQSRRAVGLPDDPDRLPGSQRQ